MLTPYANVNILLEQLVTDLKRTLGKNLVGIYLYGSLVWGDFDIEISDIDLMVATKTGIDEKEFFNLDKMQDDFVKSYRKWDSRIEIAYLAVEALETIKTAHSQIAIISPGEPFHFKEAGTDWLINAYLIREKGLALFGPPPKEIIASISKAEFIQAVKQQTVEWGEWIVHTKDSRPYQAYAILTMCRALYALKMGEPVSKKKAAGWVSAEVPQWAGLIQKALGWRDDYLNKDIRPAETYPETVKFVNFAIAVALASGAA